VQKLRQEDFPLNLISGKTKTVGCIVFKILLLVLGPDKMPINAFQDTCTNLKVRFNTAGLTETGHCGF